MGRTLQDILFDSEPELDKAPLKQPSKKWRNRYEALCECKHNEDNLSLKKGETFTGKAVWPSKDYAETVGERWCERLRKEAGTPVIALIETFEVDDG